MKPEKFKNPPMQSRSAPFWSWNDNFTAEELTRQIREMSEKGWGSFFMHSRVGLVTPYLKEEWFKLTNVCCEVAEKENMQAHMYDEDKWPSGFAGGEVTKHKDYRERSLCLIGKDELIEDDEILSEYDGKLIVRRISPTGIAWFNDYCYADLMNKDAVDEFFRVTHEKYAENCGQHFEKTIPTMFTDEPCFSYHCKKGGRGENNCDFMPWTDKMPEIFMKEKGYDLTERLPALFYETEGFEKVRFDFFDVALKTFINSFTKPYAEWCEKHNIAMTGHFMCEDLLSAQTAWTGASMPHYEYMQRPGIDKLNRNVSIPNTVKQLTSVSEQFEKERNLSEVFGCMGQHASFFHRKWISQWQAVLGIDFINHHLSLYSMRGERKRDYPANLFYQQPWWHEERSFSDYTARMCEYVNQTRRDVDILFLHPVTTAWCLFDTHAFLNHLPSKIDLYQHEFIELTKALLAARLDFHYGDETIMKNHASVKGGALCIGKFTYRTVVIPPMANITSDTAKLLKSFAENGGRIICQTPHAYLVDGEKSDIDFLSLSVMCDRTAQTVSETAKLYPDRISVTETLSNLPSETIYAEHKSDDKYEYYFIVSTEETRTFDVKISIKTDKHISILDLSDGEAYALDTESSNGRKEFCAKFYPAGALLLRLSENAKNDENGRKPYLGTGVALHEAKPICSLRPLGTKLLNENALVINDATLEMGGKLIAENVPLSALWHTHFYPAPDGTEFKAAYSFDVNSMPEGGLTAVIEEAQNLEHVTFNGKEVSLPAQNDRFDETCYLDVNFRRVNIGMPKIGKNTLIIKGKKVNNISGPGCHTAVADNHAHKPTELEAIYIIGNFSVDTLDNVHFAINSPHTVYAENITESGCPFYAGSADISFEFETEGDLPKYLQLEGVDASCVRLYVNGTDCGIGCWEPFVYDISKAVKRGKNTVTARLSTTLFNMMGPNRIDGILSRDSVSPNTFIEHKHFSEKYTLCRYGIKGAVLLK